jgi:enoyl-CoA hydratase/carnithine racemase
MTTLSQYENQFDFIHFRRDDGILLMRLHTEDGPFIFSEKAHRAFARAFAAVAQDEENKVVILTGTGDRFCADFNYESFHSTILGDLLNFWIHLRRDGVKMLTSFLDIPVPVIAAINGPALSHSELPLLADVVLSSDNTEFQDATHFIAGLPPGDGMHIIWGGLLGPNRSRSFLMTGQRINAEEAQRLGVVAEVLPLGNLLDRAWSLARSWNKLPRVTLLNTRAMLTATWKRALTDHLHTGLTYEAMAGMTVNHQPPPAPIFDLMLKKPF